MSEPVPDPRRDDPWYDAHAEDPVRDDDADDPGYEVRAQNGSRTAVRAGTERYQHDGWLLLVDDLPGIRVAAGVRPVELLVAGALPAPIREARIAGHPRPGGGVVVAAAARWVAQRRTGFSVLGNDVVGAILARLVSGR